MPFILGLDMSGMPNRWLFVEQAITYHARDMVAWSLGRVVCTYHGGICRVTGERSSLSTKSIIAIKGAIKFARDHPEQVAFPHDAHTLLGAFSIAAVSDAGSLYRSPDLGATWMRFVHDVSIDSTLMIIAASAQSPARVYCAARRGQVFGTEDGGRNWQTYPLPAEGVYALSCV